MNWYIGQEIVCINDKKFSHQGGSGTGLNADCIYTIKALRLCECGDVEICVGIKSFAGTGICKCGLIKTNDGEFRWHNENRFRPLDEIADISELTEHLKQTKPFTVNPTNK